MNDLSKLIEIIKKLRAPGGCDWDREQTDKSLIPYLLEETYEVIEAIENNDYSLLKEELGDLLLHIVFQAELLSEKTKYNLQESIDNVSQKLINRHPHIFESKKNKNWDKSNWELTKQKEKKRESILDGVPISFPGLLRSRRIQEKAASVGFDWDKKERVLEKLDEEVKELKDAINKNEGIEEELGDVLFTVVNLSRHLDYNPESALKSSIEKFCRRFKRIEKDLKQNNINMKDLSLDELDKIWEKNKRSHN